MDRDTISRAVAAVGLLGVLLIAIDTLGRNKDTLSAPQVTQVMSEGGFLVLTVLAGVYLITKIVGH